MPVNLRCAQGNEDENGRRRVINERTAHRQTPNSIVYVLNFPDVMAVESESGS